MSTLGELSPDPAGNALGTGYQRFCSNFGIDGLARTFSKDKLELLAVVSTDEGRGNFRRFIESCKGEYQRIYIWEIFNPVLHGVLKRYGFAPTKMYEQDREWVEGWRWEKTPEPTNPVQATMPAKELR